MVNKKNMKLKKSHREKLRLARRMMTGKEIKRRVAPFQSKWWEARKITKANNKNNLKKEQTRLAKDVIEELEPGKTYKAVAHTSNAEIIKKDLLLKKLWKKIKKPRQS